MKDVKPALFVNDPNKEVVTVDLHQEQALAETEVAEASAPKTTGKSDAPVESSSLFSAENGKKTASFVKTNKSSVDDISKSVTSAQSQPTTLGQVEGAAKTVGAVEDSLGSSGALSSLSPEQKNMIAATADAASDTGKSTIMINGIKKEIDKGDNLSVASLTKTLNSLSGQNDFELLDIGSELAFINTITTFAMAWGIPELIDAGIQRMKDEKERKRQMLEALIKASRQGDVDQVNYWMGKVESKKVRANAEKLYNNILKFYKPKKDEKPIVSGRKLLDLLNRLKPGWDSYGSHKSLAPYMQANSKALEVLQYTDRGKYAASQLHFKLREESVDAVMKKTFPQLSPAFGEFTE